MCILLAAATPLEIRTITAWLPTRVQPVITGVGLLSAAYHLQKAIAAYTPDLVIQAGIAGCFDPSRDLGELVVVSEEVVADLGVTENGHFKSLFDLALAAPDDPPYTRGRLPNPYLDRLNLLGWPSGSSVSVSEISTDTDRIAWYKQRYNPLLESMEGAALHFVCLQEQVPFLQLRALSNYIGERDKSRWQLGASLVALHEGLSLLLDALTAAGLPKAQAL